MITINIDDYIGFSKEENMLTMRELILKALIDRRSPGEGEVVGLILTIFHGDGEKCEVFYDKDMVVVVGRHWFYVTHGSVDRLLEDATSVSAIYEAADDTTGYIDYTYPQENDVDMKLV